MKRASLVLAVVALALPGAGLAKGPSEALITGPGGGGSSGDITVTGCCANDTPTMMLAEDAGFFPAVFGQQPSPMLDARPEGKLGPKYAITYTVPGPNNETFKIKQDLYPYAAAGPVTYMNPGQPVFDTQTQGGWFQASSELKQTLVAAGLPMTAAAASSSGGWSIPTLAASALALMLLLTLTVVLLRRRRRPATGMAGSPS